MSVTRQKRIYRHVQLSNLKQYLFALILLLTFFNTYGRTKGRKSSSGVMGGINVYAGDLGNSIKDFTYNSKSSK